MNPGRARTVSTASPNRGSDERNISTIMGRAGDDSVMVESTNMRPPAWRTGAGDVICQIEMPNGLMGSVIIC